MKSNEIKIVRRERRKTGIRKRVFGTPERPRLSIYRSNQHVYVQIIDDVEQKTLAAASSGSLEKGSNVDSAKAVGKAIAEKALAAGVQQVVFDRNGYLYHGRVKALADAAREAGLKF